MKRIAVLMSAYNGEKFIREQINSILDQKGDFKLFLFVRDDGSIDNTAQILNEYQNFGALSWYPGQNIKTALSFLDLLRRYQGFDYYAFADQDDFWIEGKIQAGINAIKEKNKPCLYFCNTEYVDSELKPLDGNTYKRNIYCDFYSTIICPGYIGSTMIFNSKLAKVIQNHRQPLVVSMHDSFIARVCVSVNGEIIYDPKVYMKYRQHGGNVIGSTVGRLDAIKRRINTIRSKPQIGISEQLGEILIIYSDCIDYEKKVWLKTVIDYKTNYINRFRLAFSNKPKYISKNMETTLKLTILLGDL